MNIPRRYSIKPNKWTVLLLFVLVILICRPWCAAAQGEFFASSGPSATFTMSPASPVANQPVTFKSSTTGNPTSWAWTFGDGATSALQSPTHAYSSPGRFTVTLRASNAAGSNMASRVVTVKMAPPVVSFSSSPNASTTGQTVNFADSSTGNPTSWHWSFGDGKTSAIQNPSHTYTKKGIFKVTLRVKNGGGTGTISRNLVVSPAGIPFTMSQTVSDGAQRTTLAFSGLAMMTGNLYSQSFFPPGKVADYTGFQYLRDNDPDNMGHNTSFLTRVANNVIYLLNDTQFAQLKTLALAQQNEINLYGYKRYSLMKAFRRLIDNDIPYGSQGLNLNAVKKASRELYLIDGQISFDRALLYSKILKSVDPTQKAYLDGMKGKGFNSWPNITNDQIRDKMQGLPHGTAVAVMTYASDLFSWYAGSVDADVYFCPERHGTYYGSFYMKDAPAVGHEGYSINEQLTATAGKALSDSSEGYVTDEQAALMSSLVDTQRNNLYGSTASNIVRVRTQIATLLRRLLSSTTYANAIKAKVLELSTTYGDLDGANNHAYATVFTQVYNTLTTGQKEKLQDLRQSILSGAYSDGTPFDFTTCMTPFLYSEAITDVGVLSPYIDNTDYLFFEP